MFSVNLWTGISSLGSLWGNYLSVSLVVILVLYCRGGFLGESGFYRQSVVERWETCSSPRSTKQKNEYHDSVSYCHTDTLVSGTVDRFYYHIRLVFPESFLFPSNRRNFSLKSNNTFLTTQHEERLRKNVLGAKWSQACKIVQASNSNCAVPNTLTCFTPGIHCDVSDADSIPLKRIKSNQEHFYLWSFILEVDWFLYAVPVPVCDFLPRSTDTNRPAPIFKGDAEWRGASSTL